MIVGLEGTIHTVLASTVNIVQGVLGMPLLCDNLNHPAKQKTVIVRLHT
jgi:hypothetical protein